MIPRSGTLFLLAAAALAAPLCLQAQVTATTDPVGFINVALAADSDTFVNLPFKRAPEYAGAVGTLTKNGVYDLGEAFTDANLNGVYDSGETYTDSFNTITPADAPAWTASQFVYAATTQPKHYYLFVAGGAKTGTFFTVVSNNTSTVTLDLAGDTISPTVASGTKVQIIPYDTLGTIFPGGQGLVGSPTHAGGARQTEVLIPDQQTAGVDLAAATSYYYFSGSSKPGWRKTGASLAVANDEILYPDSFFIIRTKASQASTVTLMGVVQMSTLQLPLNRLAANLSQDNAVSLPIASSLTLKQTNLFESGAFVGSPTHAGGDRMDELLVWDNTEIGHDKAATKSYYYYSGTDGSGAGWRLAGDSVAVRDNTDFVITPTTAIVVRKKGATTAGTSFWLVKPPYVP